MEELSRSIVEVQGCEFKGKNCLRVTLGKGGKEEVFRFVLGTLNFERRGGTRPQSTSSKKSILLPPRGLQGGLQREEGVWSARKTEISCLLGGEGASA